MNPADLVGWEDFGPLRIFGRRHRNMRSLEELYSISLLGSLDRLFEIQEGKTKGSVRSIVFGSALRAQGFIDWPYNRDMMPDSVEAAEKLMAVLVPLGRGDDDETIGDFQVSIIRNAYNTFRTHLKAELNDLPVFLVQETRAYAPKLLINQPHKLFSKDAVPLLESLPTAQTDFAEAAKCLAFDRPTAVGFHALRAVEEVTRCYYAMITGRSHSGINTNDKRFFRTLAAMVKELKNELPDLEKAGDVGRLPLILVLLQQLTEVYRNPLDHPEIPELKPDEGVDVFNHAINVISEIFREIQTRKYFAHTFG
ncbi:MAG: hypothetical protein ACLQB4_10295 [Beijerinckiaceae bacterium]